MQGRAKDCSVKANMFAIQLAAEDFAMQADSM
jgi:hypothetical protein